MLACAVVFSALSTSALAAVAKYRGMHPLSPHTGAYCYIDVLHVHAKAPPDMRVYRVLPNQEHLFVGDEAALGYDGPRHGYFGPHPLTFPDLTTPEPIFCYFRGSHQHARKPDASQKFVFKDGVYWYVGSFPPEFERDRHNLWINDAGSVAKYQRPKVDITAAPAGYQLPAVVEPPKPQVPTGQPTASAKSAGPAGAVKVAVRGAPGPKAAPVLQVGEKPGAKPAEKARAKTAPKVGAASKTAGGVEVKEGGP